MKYHIKYYMNNNQRDPHHGTIQFDTKESGNPRQASVQMDLRCIFQSHSLPFHGHVSPLSVSLICCHPG